MTVNPIKPISADSIRQALEEGQFVIYYQPQVRISDATVFGVEALVRWQHPEFGLLSPGSFLPIIDGHPLMGCLDQYVLEHAVIQWQTWNARGLRTNLSTNVSPQSLQQKSFLSFVKMLVLNNPALDPRALKIEVLETASYDDIVLSAEIMQDCRTHGLEFALDDFGTGHSILNHLKHFPVSYLKIDQSFVRDALSSVKDHRILEGLWHLSQALEVKPIAEGVETPLHIRMLCGLGYDLIQGYAIAKPMPASGLIDWVKAFSNHADPFGMSSLKGRDIAMIDPACSDCDTCRLITEYCNPSCAQNPAGEQDKKPCRPAIGCC